MVTGVKGKRKQGRMERREKGHDGRILKFGKYKFEEVSSFRY